MRKSKIEQLMKEYFINEEETFYDTVNKELNRTKMRKLAILLYSHLRGNLEQKRMWHWHNYKIAKELKKKRLKLIRKKKVFELKKLSIRETIISMDMMANAYVEVEYLSNIIIAMNMKNIDDFIKRVMNGNLHRLTINSRKEKLDFKDLLKEGYLLELFLKIYNPALVEKHPLSVKDNQLILAFYKHEIEFIKEVFKMIPNFIEFSKDIRHNLYHRSSYLCAIDIIDSESLFKFKDDRYMSLIFKYREEVDNFNKYFVGFETTEAITFFTSLITKLQEVLLWQIIYSLKYDMRIVHSLVSDYSQINQESYYQIWKQMSMYSKHINFDITDSEFGFNKNPNTHQPIRMQTKFNDDISRFKKKYPISVDEDKYIDISHISIDGSS